MFSHNRNTVDGNPWLLPQILQSQYHLGVSDLMPSRSAPAGDAIGSYNECENMLYKGEAYLAQHKKELSREQRSELKSAISDLKHSMKRIKPQNITEEQGRAIKEASERVNQLIR